jgi:hypothetical protein
MWCWRRMEKISWTDHVRNEEVLFTVKEQRNTLHEISKRKFNWIGHILRRNCLLRQFIEGKIKGGIEVTGRRGRRRRKLLDDLKERRGYSQLKGEALDRTMWTARFGRGIGPVVRQTTKWMSEWMDEWMNPVFWQKFTNLASLTAILRIPEKTDLKKCGTKCVPLYISCSVDFTQIVTEMMKAHRGCPTLKFKQIYN